MNKNESLLSDLEKHVEVVTLEQWEWGIDLSQSIELCKKTGFRVLLSNSLPEQRRAKILEIPNVYQHTGESTTRKGGQL